MMTGETAAATSRYRFSSLIFGLTILIGAFLLFQVQPLISKAILPWFGGAAAVWTTCMLFFQTLLFGGYLYAHLLQLWFKPRSQAVVHLALVVGALALLPILPEPNWKPTGSEFPTWHILLLLTVFVGLPYFALSGTSPLVQAWFSVRCRGRSPYRLYALSNFGSLAALLSYPFVFEPALDLPTQAGLWGAAFAVYAGLCAACFAVLWKVDAASRRVDDNSCGVDDIKRRDAASAKPTGILRFCWLALPACASLFLLAATNHICQDVASVPFLWVMPLSLYLLSFIISFDHERWYVRRLWSALAIVTLTALVGYDYLRSEHPLGLPWELTLNFSALFFACMVCHGELARLKPQPRYLTEFYLLIAVGGALGGLFVAVVAPLVFSSYFEWQIAIVAAALLAFGLVLLPGRAGRRGITYYAVIAPLIALGMAYLFYWGFEAEPTLQRTRNFFGVVAVRDDDANNPENHIYRLVHGRITHGLQSPGETKRRWPTAYYGKDSGVGLAIEYLQEKGPIRVGAIGLGVGTVASYARPGDVFHFYEINPAVPKLAREYFSYLSDCRGTCDVVLGDARLSLEAEPTQKFNLLIIDAFSGDAIPTHLLTREAFEVYRRHLASGGIIAVHISNNYLDLAPVVRSSADHFGMKAVRLHASGNDERLTYANTWMLVTEDEDFANAHPAQTSDSEDDDRTVPLWTDQYSNLFQILSKGFLGF